MGVKGQCGDSFGVGSHGVCDLASVLIIKPNVLVLVCCGEDGQSGVTHHLVDLSVCCAICRTRDQSHPHTRHTLTSCTIGAGAVQVEH